MEAELFGYEKGAFTGAREKGKMGLFELANHGTILLDEIGDMSLSLQAKLLRTIQENEIMRLGGITPIQLDVRIISATSRNIDEMVAEGLFLDALYYRLNVVELQIPPLRERREDILPLTEFYLQHFCEKYKLSKEFTADVRSCFLQYDWPGNVRELENCMERAVLTAQGECIHHYNLPPSLQYNRTYQEDPETDGKPMIDVLLSGYERELILQAIRRSKGNLSEAGRELGISPRMMNYRMGKLKIKPE